MNPTSKRLNFRNFIKPIMTPRKMKWLAFEVGLVLVATVVLVKRAVTAVDFSITYDGYAFGVLCFGVGMLVRELFVE